MEDLFSKRILVLGCGNLLFGDDAFGPLVANRLNKEGVPQDVAVIDAGTGVRDVLFDLLLLEKKPEKVIVIDAVDINRRKGEVFLLDLDAVPAVKTDDFSLHQVPTSNMLKELRDRCGVEVTVVGCQPDFIPAEIRMEVSENVRSAIGGAADLVRSLF